MKIVNISANSAKQPTRLNPAHRFATGSRVRADGDGMGSGNVMAPAVRAFAAAASHCPIVFAAGSTLSIAVLGWREGQNGAANPWDAAESLDAQFEETRHFGVWQE